MQAYPWKWVDSEAGESGEESALDQGDGHPGLGEDSLLSQFSAFQAITSLHLTGTGCAQSHLPPLFSAFQHMQLPVLLTLEDFDLPEMIPSDLGQLTTLAALILRGWKRLREPRECLGKLSRLDHTTLPDLPGLSKSPESVSAIPSSSTTLSHEPPRRLRFDMVSTNSWSSGMLWQTPFTMDFYEVVSEKWEKARKMAIRQGPGARVSTDLYVLNRRLARELFPDMGFSCCGRSVSLWNLCAGCMSLLQCPKSILVPQMPRLFGSDSNSGRTDRTGWN